MNADVIVQLVEVAISLAQTQLDPKEAGSAVLRMVQTAAQAYEKQTGQPLDPNLITSEAPL